MDIGRLIDVAPRDAWPNEAGDFTPWLARNLDRLSEAIGVPLELEGSEVAVESFSADILARNLADNSLVLIENQLYKTDHTHLGQIVTYLAGLNASTVVWIAREFREPHLSAIRWLNEHTVDPIAFFAIRLRVVRIGDSLPAPILDVLERPNEWERQVRTTVQENADFGELALFRRSFWEAYRQSYPDDVELGVPVGHSTWWWMLADRALIISIYVLKKGVGLFVRGLLNVVPAETRRLLEPFADHLAVRLGATLAPSEEVQQFWLERQWNMLDRANWNEAITWMHDKAHLYHRALTEVVTAQELP